MSARGTTSRRRTIRPSRVQNEREPDAEMERDGDHEPYDDDESYDDDEPYGEEDQGPDDEGDSDEPSRPRRSSDPAPRGGRSQPRAQRPRAQRSGRATRRIAAAGAAQAAVRQLTDLTARQPEGVTAIEPLEDGWVVGVEVVEDHRIPSSADILAIYEARIGFNGDLVSYRRTKRYARGRGDDGGGGA